MKEYIKNLRISKKQAIITLILLLGIVFGVILVQKPQIFKGRADVDISSALNIQGTGGEAVKCVQQTCTTKAEEVTIEVKDPDIFLKD
ncbi:MAG: hypothetical protein AAB414_00370 [Patescibacteria group bacterium]